MYRSWNFVIENFGFDGLNLIYHGDEDIADSIQVNDLLDVHFDIEQQAEQKSFNLEVSVVRVHHDNIAVSLFNPALDAISELSKKQHRDNTHADSSLINTLDKKSLNILEIIKHRFLKNISHATEIFFPVAYSGPRKLDNRLRYKS
ncbi:MAG: hypothetical protein KZQ64_04065 [gamma proteobacterium symbiont of Bathyaustriella thionipta]|nr:hypothetical protein [gamma proteobacterium symbiont of Bathyaustriella thionipta]